VCNSAIQQFSKKKREKEKKQEKGNSAIQQCASRMSLYVYGR
jgi:hypothetical protein